MIYALRGILFNKNNNFQFFVNMEMLRQRIKVKLKLKGIQEVEEEINIMSTSQLYLSKQEIEELVRDIPQDTSILYGEENQEFGVCPYITFYICNKDCVEILNKVVAIYIEFLCTRQISQNPYPIRILLS